MFQLHVSPQDFSIIWACLGKQPAEVTFAVMEKLKQQVAAQEAQMQAAPVEGYKDGQG